MALVTGSIDGQQYQYDDGQPAPGDASNPYDPNSWAGYRYANGYGGYAAGGEHVDQRTVAALNELQKQYGLSSQSISDLFNKTYGSVNPQAGYNSAQFGNTLLSAIGQNHGIDVSKYLIDPNSSAYQQAASAGVARDANIKAHDDAAHGSLKEFVPFALSVAAMAAGGNYLSGLGGGGAGLGADGFVGPGMAGVDASTAALGSGNLAAGTGALQLAGDASGVGSAGSYAGNAGIDGINSSLGLNGVPSWATTPALESGGLDTIGQMVTQIPPGMTATTFAQSLGFPSADAWLASAGMGGAAGGVASLAGSGTSEQAMLEAARTQQLDSLAKAGVSLPAGATGAASVFSKILDGTATADDWLSLAGKAIPGLVGAYGANKQAGQLSDLAGQFSAYGAPSRARYEASMSPGFDPTTIPGYSGALDSASKAVMSKLSTQGNPYGNPGGLIEANKQIVSGTALPAIQNYQNQNAAAGGISQLAGAVPGISQQAIGSAGGALSSLGSAAANVLNPTSNPYGGTIADFLKSLAKGGGGNSYGLA